MRNLAFHPPSHQKLCRKLPNARLDQFDDAEEDKWSQTLSYLRGTLNEEARDLMI